MASSSSSTSYNNNNSVSAYSMKRPFGGEEQATGGDLSNPFNPPPPMNKYKFIAPGIQRSQAASQQPHSGLMFGGSGQAAHQGPQPNEQN